MSRLHELLAEFSDRRVAVVGDVMLDDFLVGRVDRISPEAPVPVVKFEREESRLGGAANVAHNARALGALVSLIGLVGNDAAAARLRKELDGLQVSHDGLVVDGQRSTTRKVRIVTTRNQQVARLDYEQDEEPADDVRRRLCEQVSRAGRASHVMVISDYHKGVVSTPLLTQAASTCAAANVPLLVDPKLPQAERYRGATLITPNHREAEQMTLITIRSAGDAREAARRLHERSGASILMTWGEHGMWLLDATGSELHEEHLPAAAREVADVTGAGDTVIASLALAIAAGASLSDAARLANLAAGLVVAKFGAAVVTPDELSGAIDRAGD